MELGIGGGGNINEKVGYNFVPKENTEDVGTLNFKFQF